ncbi:MAG: synaptobrevin family protein [Gammaproteobacteria bacterium]
MKIFSIVVFKDNNSVSLVATTPTNQLRENMLKTTILEGTIKQSQSNPSFKYDMPIKTLGGGDKAIYYSIIFKDKQVVAFAADEIIQRDKLDTLFYAMKTATSISELHKILVDPKKFSESKIEKIQAMADDTKEIMLSNIDKVLERGDKIDALLDKTTDLGANSFRFKRKATRLSGGFFCRERFCCCLPGSNDERTYVQMGKNQRS